MWSLRPLETAALKPGYVWNKIISKLLQCFLHVIADLRNETLWNNSKIISAIYFLCNYVGNWNKMISASVRGLKLIQNYLSNIEHVWKYSWAAVSLWKIFEIISDKFPRAEVKLFQTDVDEGWNNFIWHATTALPCDRQCGRESLHYGSIEVSRPVVLMPLRNQWQSAVWHLVTFSFWRFLLYVHYSIILVWLSCQKWHNCMHQCGCISEHRDQFDQFFLLFKY